MPVRLDTRSEVIMLWRYPTPYYLWRLRELHQIAIGDPPSERVIVDERLSDPSKAAEAYERSLGCLFADLLLMHELAFERHCEQMYDFAAKNGLDGLEAPLITSLLNLRETGQLWFRGASLLRDLPFPASAAAGKGRLPTLDRTSGRFSFPQTDLVRDAVNAVIDTLSPGLTAPSGSYNGRTGRAGSGAAPVGNPPAMSRMDRELMERGADSNAGSHTNFCDAVGKAVTGTIAGGVAASGAALGGTIGAGGGPPGAIIGAVIGGTIGTAVGIFITEYFDTTETTTAWCEAVLKDDETDEETWPLPDSADTGLTPSDEDMARAVLRQGWAKRPTVDGSATTMGGQPVFIRSIEGLINPDDGDMSVLGPATDDKQFVDPRTWIMGSPRSPAAPAAPSVVRAPDKMTVSFEAAGRGTVKVAVGAGETVPVNVNTVNANAASTTGVATSPTGVYRNLGTAVGELESALDGLRIIVEGRR
jgi:hypothetical protein